MGPIISSLFLILLLAEAKGQQLESPCPRLFFYEPQKENDRWYGVVTLISESDLSGVWLRLIFDRAASSLGNWFGDISTKDNKEFLLKNRTHMLKANMPFSLRILLQYNPAEPPPELIRVKLNAKVICPEGEATTESPNTGGQLRTSRPIVETVKALSPSDETPNFVRDSPLVTPGGANGFFAGNNLAQQYECGTVVLQPAPLIVLGLPTFEGEFPWHAALYDVRRIDPQYICGGALISTNYLLSAAHCVTRPQSQITVNPEHLKVYLGKFYLKRWSNPGIQGTQLSEIITHPDYNSINFANDIAVIKLTNPVDITDYVRPVCLWEGKANIRPLVNKLGTIAGWGFDETGQVTDMLMQTKMPIVSKETCIYSRQEFFARFTTEKTFCAGFRNGTTVCSGDSGGGMVVPKQTSPQASPVWQLRGLVSLSAAVQRKCDAANYVVFTDVAKYLDWIKKTTSLT